MEEPHYVKHLWAAAPLINLNFGMLVPEIETDLSYELYAFQKQHTYYEALWLRFALVVQMSANTDLKASICILTGVVTHWSQQFGITCKYTSFTLLWIWLWIFCGLIHLCTNPWVGFRVQRRLKHQMDMVLFFFLLKRCIAIQSLKTVSHSHQAFWSNGLETKFIW